MESAAASSSSALTCGLCFDQVDNFASTSCGHSCCNECMIDFLKASCIDQNKPSCFSCAATLSSSEVAALLLQCNRSDLMAVFGDRCLDRMMRPLLATEGRYCPDCSAPIVGGCSKEQFWSCVCGCSFCQDCMKPESVHSKRKSKCSEKFRLFKSAEEKNERLFAEWKEEQEETNEPIKACPNCGTGISKSEACNHMTCRNCNFEFCYLCLAKYYDDATDDYHFSGYNPKVICTGQMTYMQYRERLAAMADADASRGGAAASSTKQSKKKKLGLGLTLRRKEKILVACTAVLWVPLVPVIGLALPAVFAVQAICDAVA